MRNNQFLFKNIGEYAYAHKATSWGNTDFIPHFCEKGGNALKWKYALTGGLAGLANGLFGSGGGLFLVPLLTQWAKLPQRKAFATSVAVILPLSLVSAGIYWYQGGLDFSGAWPYLIGGAVGGLLSGKLFRRVSLTFLRRAFGLLILYGGIRAVLAL